MPDSYDEFSDDFLLQAAAPGGSAAQRDAIVQAAAHDAALAARWHEACADAALWSGVLSTADATAEAPLPLELLGRFLDQSLDERERAAVLARVAHDEVERRRLVALRRERDAAQDLSTEVPVVERRPAGEQIALAEARAEQEARLALRRKLEVGAEADGRKQRYSSDAD